MKKKHKAKRRLSTVDFVIATVLFTGIGLNIVAGALWL